ncbi:baseplate J/gp47 family protein [Clostridium peptidivorans]|uniref:baseplate J/gp47 family protein n=1 Tax=Clostridium peptidivorans TaxID=100174 RepID=UPI000BE22E29|nr:baseplate J/gp47 family protein [Clostridium peptidivorans]
MFEENTEEVILKRMLDKTPDDIDKRESSLLYNTLAPVSLELAFAYSNLDRFLSYAFPEQDTPVEFIEKRANEEGIKIKQAESAVKKGYFYDSNKKFIDIPLGSRFSIDKFNFKAIEKIEPGIYKMECEKTGVEGNNPSGQLIPIDYIENLSIAELGEIIREGIDIESGEDLFNRYSEKIQKPITSGNPNHYKQWAKEVAGVGDAKPVPLWAGNGTVKVVIMDSNKKAPSKELIDKVFEHIEEARPIGPKVTIIGVTEKQLSVTANIALANGFNIGQVQQEFIILLDKYLKDIAFKLTYISIARIGNLLLNTPGVLDYMNLKINNSTANIGLQDEEVPVLGTVELGV